MWSGMEYRLVFRVAAGVNDSVHVQVEVVKLHVVGIWLSRVHRDL